MEIVSDLKEVSYKNSFKWRIYNLPLPKFTNDDKELVIKSEESFFEEANATWYMKLNLINRKMPERYFRVTFFLLNDGQDENARYKFSVKMGGKTIIESAFVKKSSKHINEPLEHRINQFISLRGADFVELELCCTVETLQHLVNVSTAEQVIDQEPEWDSFQADEVKLSASVDEKVALKVETENAKMVEAKVSANTTLASSGSKMKIDCSDTSKASNTKPTVTDRICNLYLEKMRQIAKHSAALLVTSAQVNTTSQNKLNQTNFTCVWQHKFQPLLNDCCASFAAQISPENFNEIWSIGKELKAEELKTHVIKWVAENPQQFIFDIFCPELILEVAHYQKKY